MRNRKLLSTLTAFAVLVSACAKSKSGAQEETEVSSALKGLQSIPSVSELITENNEQQAAGLIKKRGAVGLQSVSGTPPTLLDIASSVANLDQYFFGGTVNELYQGNANQNTINRFWQGQSACMMGQSVAESLDRVLQEGTTLCYMQKAPTARNGVQVTKGNVAQEALFTQVAEDRLVKVNVTNIPDQNAPGDMAVFIRVMGSRSVTSALYQAYTYECQNGEVKGRSVFYINRNDGTYTTSSEHSSDDGKGAQTLTAKLTTRGGRLAFDAKYDRQMLSHWSGQWGVFKGGLTIKGDNTILAKRYNQYTYNNQTSTDKNYSVASFTGGSLSELRFLDAASKGSSNWQGIPHLYEQAVEYHTSLYESVEESAKLTQVQAMNINTDAFFASGLAVTDPDFSGIDCNAVADVEVAIDMSAPAMVDVRTECEGERFRDYNMCQKDQIQTAQYLIFNYYNQHGGN